MSLATLVLDLGLYLREVGKFVESEALLGANSSHHT